MQSFVLGTKVLLADGASKPIEKLKLGDKVKATDPTTGQTTAEPVVATIIGQGAKHLVDVAVTGRKTDGTTVTVDLVVTDGHPFSLASERRWVTATELSVGDILKPVGSGVGSHVTAITRYDATARVHNLTISGLHTYYVMAGRGLGGAAETVNAVLVHNCGGDEVAGVGEYLAKKAPDQVRPGIRSLEGQHINNRGRVEPWVAHYDEFGRQIGRTDYNAGNKAAGIPSTHYHRYEFGPGWGNRGKEVEAHVPGEFPG